MTMVVFMSFVASRHVNICSCFCFADIALAADAFGHLAACVVFVACAITVVHCALCVGAAVAIPGVEGGRVLFLARKLSKTWTHPARVRPWKAQSNTYLCNLFRGSNGK